MSHISNTFNDERLVCDKHDTKFRNIYLIN